MNLAQLITLIGEKNNYGGKVQWSGKSTIGDSVFLLLGRAVLTVAVVVVVVVVIRRTFACNHCW
jgi:hypothetical protein